MYSNLLDAVNSEWKLILIFIVGILVYKYYTSTFNFFKRKGVKYIEPTIFLGNLGPRLRAKISIHEFNLQIYRYFSGNSIGGIFEGRKPILYIFNPDYIKNITTRNFDHFVDRNTLNSKENFLSKSLINLKGSEWKCVRSTVSPAFSSARLRHMLPLIENCSQQMVQYMNQHDEEDLEMKDTLGHYTLEVIGACAFGIKCDALSGDNEHFVKVASKFNEMGKLKRIFIFFVLIFIPKLFRHLNISFLNKESLEELVTILKTAKTERRAKGVKRNDFLQLLIDAADKENDDKNNGGSKYQFDDKTIDAQSLLFLLGGYETTSTLLSFAIHTLVIRPDIQTKLREHIEEKTKGSEVTYETLSELTYLDGFLLETLRMYPPLARIDRVCTKKYMLPETSVVVDVGETVALPVYALHMDPEIYEEPYEFRPERFMGDEKSSRPSHLFLAFGAGPRSCIGARFAIISAKLALVSLLKNFSFSSCSKTQNPIKFDKRSILLKSECGVWVKVHKL